MALLNNEIHVDCIGQELKIGDKIAFVYYKRSSVETGEIVSFTKRGLPRVATTARKFDRSNNQWKTVSAVKPTSYTYIKIFDQSEK